MMTPSEYHFGLRNFRVYVYEFRLRFTLNLSVYIEEL